MMNINTSEDIIAAVATAWGEGAIAVVRVSGAGSLALADCFFKAGKPLAAQPPRRMSLGHVVGRDGQIVDQVLAVHFPGGASYTGEESVEIHCHGGAMAARCCLELLLEAGARMALPGEFTRRAFSNGRIDLAQAEAVAGVVRARSAAALASAERSLQGGLSGEISRLLDSLTALRASLEVRLDYPDEADSDGDDLENGLRALLKAAGRLLDRCRAGATLQSGVAVAILGRPNVGKSSLLNALLEESRAIVTDIPGTTRDSVEALTVYKGMPIRLCDTAGIRDASDPVESAGVERSRAAMRGSDVRLLVIDASAPLTYEDRSIAESLRGLDSRGGIVVVLNKCDLTAVFEADGVWEDFGEPVRVSALTGEGLDCLRDRIFAIALSDQALGESYAATERMVEALARSIECLETADGVMIAALGVDLVGSLLAEAASHLGTLLGRGAGEELLDAIFSTFCVGK